MAQRIALHIGAPKSGTTYLQSILWANRAALRAAGVLLPGRARFSHTRAASAVASDASGRNAKVWERFIEQLNEWPGDAVISDEWFVPATRAQVGRALAPLRDAEVHVVFTARDFVRQVPAAWQEPLKVGRGSSMREFVDGLDDASRKWSWRSLDPAEILPEWAAHVPADRIHVVTVPTSGAPRDLLWRRFAQACGFDPAIASLDTTDANESLGAESARLLQELGPDLRQAVGADDGDWRVQFRWLRRYVGHDILVPLGGSRIGLGREDVDLVRVRTAETLKRIVAAGWDVVGNLDDLTAATYSPDDRNPDTVTAEEMLVVARSLVSRLLAEVQELSGDASPADDESGGH